MNSLRKYFCLASLAWESLFIYRLNFFIWRLRAVINHLGGYFFWLAVYRFNQQIADYDAQMMLTYVLLSSFLYSLVLISRTAQVSGDIAQGGLNQYLLKPMGYFQAVFSLDLGDKAAGLLFLLLEMTVFFLVLKPPFFWQTNSFYLISFLLVSFLGMFVYFYLSLLIGLTAFWYPEHGGWPVRFLFQVVNQFLSGGLIPLDILPVPVFGCLRFLPSAYFVFFPLQVYLGRLSLAEVLGGLAVLIFWLWFLRIVVRLVWDKGLKNYTAAGR